MTATAALSARPAYATVCWCDRRYIYVEYPTTGPTPYIEKYELTDGGLSKALGLMRSLHEAAAAPVFTIPKHPLLKQVGTSAQRDNALSVLRKLRIV